MIESEEMKINPSIHSNIEMLAASINRFALDLETIVRINPDSLIFCFLPSVIEKFFRKR